jgi:hypothetical protein
MGLESEAGGKALARPYWYQVKDAVKKELLTARVDLPDHKKCPHPVASRRVGGSSGELPRQRLNRIPEAVNFTP